MNTNAWGGQQASSEVEEQVLDWFRTLLGFPGTASGLLTTGASAANLVALAVARDASPHYDRESGASRDGIRPVIYASTETHNSVSKAVGLLGLGTAALRRIPVQADFTIDLAALRSRIAGDIVAGCRPLCLVANVGTVNTGAIDDVASLASIARAHGAWLHIDGAFGALAALAPGGEALRQRLALADSIAFDLHKWLSVQYDCGGVLIRDPERHRASFGAAASYLEAGGRGLASGTTWFNELGLELSRGFRALKVWMTIKEHGIERLGGQIARNIRQAQYLEERIGRYNDLEMLAPVPLNVVAFRVAPPGVAAEQLDALNRAVLVRVQESGVAVPSGTMLNGRFAIRVAVVNHRSRDDDFDLLLDTVRRLAAEVAREMAR